MLSIDFHDLSAIELWEVVQFEYVQNALQCPIKQILLDSRLLCVLRGSSLGV